MANDLAPIPTMRLDAAGREDHWNACKQVLVTGVPDQEHFRHFLGGAGQLQWVHIPSAGLDSISGYGLNRRSCVITNAGPLFAASIAEYVLAYILAISRDILVYRRAQEEGEWAPRPFQNLAKLNVAIIGTGHVGRAVYNLLTPLGCCVRMIGSGRTQATHGYDHVLPPDRMVNVLADSDYVVAAVPLTPATQGVFDAAFFRLMKRDAWFINVGRGASVDEDSLSQALGKGSLGGAVLDVTSKEPLPLDADIRLQLDVLVTPHCSGDYLGWEADAAQQFVDNWHRFIGGLKLLNVVSNDRL